MGKALINWLKKFFSKCEICDVCGEDHSDENID